jgi:CzcA family heavy metal efflux pump
MKNFFSSYRSPIGFMMALVIAGGVFAYTHIQSALFPEVTFPKIKVIADNGEQPVDKMMITITRPLENAIKLVPNLKMVRSITSRGSCELSAFIDWKADVDISKQQIESRINQIRNLLPPTTQITIEKMAPSILPVSGYTLESNNKDPIELKLIANYTVKPFLSQVEGVSSVAILGGKTKEYWVVLKPELMTELGITIDTLATVLNQTNFINSNGYMSDYRRLYLTITDAGLNDKEALENLVIKSNNRRLIQLKDIADIQISKKVEFIKINANGQDAMLINILMQPNANLVDLSSAMDLKIKELQKILPQGVFIKPYYKQSDFVNSSIHSVTESLWIGLLLAIVVSIIFLRSFKASTAILITIPVTIGFTIIVIYALGYTFNIMTLGAIAAAIGLIIDDAIVVVEQIHRSHEEHPELHTTVVVRRAIKYLFPAMVGSSLSTIVIFVPFMLMSGVAGAYFHILTNTMIITLVCSFFVTWLGLPVIYILFTKHNTDGALKKHQVHLVKKQRWVSFFIMRPIISFLMMAGFVVALILVYPLLQTGFLPEMDEGSIVLDYNSPAGTSLEETDRMLREIEKTIVTVPEVESYSRRTGTQMGFYITEPNRGDYLIQLKQNHKRTTVDVIDDLRKKIESTQPAIRADFGQVIGDMLGDLMASTQPIEIKIFGNSQAKLNELAQSVSDEVSKVKGTADVFNGITIAGPTISVFPNVQKLAQYNLTPASLQYQLQTQLEGEIVGNVLEKEQQTDIRLIFPHAQQGGVAHIKDEYVFLAGGKLKPVSEVATVQIGEGIAEIQRENLQSMAVVTGRLNNRDLGSTINEIRKNIDAKIHLPQGYYISYGGAYADQKQSFKELLIILVTALLLVFAVILFLFRKLRVGLVILVIAALGVAGSFLALFLTGTPLNVGSYTGIIMIVGIIGENSIFTYQQFKTTLALEGNVDNAIIYSISTRLRPKLMTAIGAIIALMPLALGIGTGAKLHQPLAIAVIGGFITALPLLLIVLPTLLRIVIREPELKAGNDQSTVSSIN